jgi:hypothetical protein
MSTRKLFLLSLVLAVVAVFLQLVGLRLMSRGKFLRAQAAQSLAARGDTSLTPQERSDLSFQTARYRRSGVNVQYGAAGIALTSAGFVIASAMKKEPAWQVVTLALLFWYAASFLILV